MKMQPTQRGNDSAEAKLAVLMEAFQRFMVGLPFVSRLDLIKSYALAGWDEFESMSDDSGKSLSSVEKSINRLRDKSLSAVNGRDGRAQVCFRGEKIDFSIQTKAYYSIHCSQIYKVILPLHILVVWVLIHVPS